MQLAAVSACTRLVVLGLKPQDEISSFSFFGPIPDIDPKMLASRGKMDDAGEIRLPVSLLELRRITQNPIRPGFELQRLLMARPVGYLVHCACLSFGPPESRLAAHFLSRASEEASYLRYYITNERG